MTVNVPQTIWRPTDGNAELGVGDSENITTLSGVDITSLSGDELVTLDGTYTPIPATVWAENDGV